MRRMLLTISIALPVYGCVQIPPAPTPPPTSMSSWGPLGGFTMSSGANCAGQAALVNGKSTVSDPCFTDTSNVVLCTDATAPSAVACKPSNGQLSISGFGNDVVAYARLR